MGTVRACPGTSTSSRRRSFECPPTPLPPTVADLAVVRRVGRARSRRRARRRRPAGPASLPRPPATRRFASRTVARKASAVRRYFGWCRRTGRIATDPAVGLHAPAGDGRLPRVLAHGELDELLAPSMPLPERRRADVGPGSRRRRARGALRQRPAGVGAVRPRLGSRSISPGRPLVVWGKGSKQRRVPLSDPAVDAVARLAGTSGRSPPTPTMRRRCSSTGASDGSDPATSAGSSTGARPSRPTPTRCATASPPTCSTAAPTCAWSKNSSATQSVATTQRYTHVSKERLRAVYERTHPRA